MPEYLIRWEIQLDADSPRLAAETAQAFMRDHESTATVFKVIDAGAIRTIDLGLDEYGNNRVGSWDAPYRAEAERGPFPLGSPEAARLMDEVDESVAAFKRRVEADAHQAFVPYEDADQRLGGNDA